MRSWNHLFPLESIAMLQSIFLVDIQMRTASFGYVMRSKKRTCGGAVTGLPIGTWHDAHTQTLYQETLYQETALMSDPHLGHKFTGIKILSDPKGNLGLHQY